MFLLIGEMFYSIDDYRRQNNLDPVKEDTLEVARFVKHSISLDARIRPMKSLAIDTFFVLFVGKCVRARHRPPLPICWIIKMQNGIVPLDEYVRTIY